MRPQVLVLGAIGVAILGIGGYYAFQKSQQNDTVKELSDRLAKLEAEKAKAPGPVFIQGANALDSQAARNAAKQKYIIDGWRLISTRTTKDADVAASLFKDGLERIDPKEPQFYNGLGRAYWILGRYEESIASFRRGLRLNPKVADMESGIAWDWWALGDPYRAKQQWDKAIAIDPNCRDALSALAWIYLAQGNVEPSKNAFRTLMDSVHNDPNASPAAKSWNTGLNLAQASNTDPAQINGFFKLPPMQQFAAARLPDFPEPPVDTQTATAPATSSKPATQPTTTTPATRP